MDFNDLTQIIINFSQALGPIQKLLSGLSYLLGIIFILKALGGFQKMAQSHHGGGGEPGSVVFSYLIVGAVLLYLPSAFTIASATVFGSGNILQYAPINPITVTSAVMLMIQTAGLIWFMRGCVLLTTQNQSGSKLASKGLVFLCAGILAMNIETTAVTLASMVSYIAAVSMSIKNGMGY